MSKKIKEIIIGAVVMGILTCITIGPVEILFLLFLSEVLPRVYVMGNREEVPECYYKNVDSLVFILNIAVISSYISQYALKLIPYKNFFTNIENWESWVISGGFQWLLGVLLAMVVAVILCFSSSKLNSYLRTDLQENEKNLQ